MLATPEPYSFVCRLLLATGLRWSDAVFIEAKHLHGDWLVNTCSKTGKLLRIPLEGTDPALAEEIRGRVGRLVPFRSSGSFNRAMKRLSGVARFSTYRLKDTFACRWLDTGGSLVDLQHILGHGDPKTTLRYGRPSDGRIMSEARRIGAAQAETVTGTGTIRRERGA